MSLQFGSTALNYASEKGHTQIVKLLLIANANPNIANDVSVPTVANVVVFPQFGSTALNYASDNGNAEIVKLLLKANANPNLVNKVSSVSNSANK